MSGSARPGTRFKGASLGVVPIAYSFRDINRSGSEGTRHESPGSEPWAFLPDPFRIPIEILSPRYS